MHRQFLQASGLGITMAFFSGCIGSSTQSQPERSTQAGSGHTCENPRNIDYDAVDEYQDHGVYLKNSAETAHTACVTVTKENGDREETVSNPPPLVQKGYAIQPGKEVEIFKFRESGRYTIEVSIERTTKTESFKKSHENFNDGKTKITTFEITGANSIRVTYSGDS